MFQVIPKDSSLSTWSSINLPGRSPSTKKSYSEQSRKGLLFPPLPGEERKPIFASSWKLREQIDLRQNGLYPLGIIRRAAVHLRSENPQVVGYFGVVLKFEINSLLVDRSKVGERNPVQKLQRTIHKLVDQDTYYRELGKLIVKIAEGKENGRRPIKTVSPDIKERTSLILHDLTKEQFALLKTSEFFGPEVVRALETLREK